MNTCHNGSLHVSDPLFPLTFLVDSWIPGMFDAVFQASFLGTLLLFWLCLYHGVRQVGTLRSETLFVKRKRQVAKGLRNTRCKLCSFSEQKTICHFLPAKDIHRGDDVVLCGDSGVMARIQRIARPNLLLQTGCRKLFGEWNTGKWLNFSQTEQKCITSNDCNAFFFGTGLQDFLFRCWRIVPAVSHLPSSQSVC